MKKLMIHSKLLHLHLNLSSMFIIKKVFFLFIHFILYSISITAQPYTGPDIVTGLQAYWKFDEGRGVQTADASGNDINGTLQSGTTWAQDGMTGNALSLDSVDSYVDFGTSILNLDSGLSVSLWIYRRGDNSAGSSNESLISRSQYGYPFLIQLQNSGYIKTFIRGTEFGYVTSNTRLEDNEWNNVVMTYKSGERILYINGTLDKTDTVVTGNLYTASGGSLPNIRIGCNGTGSNSMWGFIDEVRIYNRVLSADDVLALYDGSGLDTTPPLPVDTVNDGLGDDMAWTVSTTSISANWTGTSDTESDVVKYYYAIGTTPGSTDVVDWTNNGLHCSFFHGGLSLTIGISYFVSIKAENSAGLESTITSSNGVNVISFDFSNLIEQVVDKRAHGPIDVINYPQNLPPLEEIINKPLCETPSSGLFTWRDTWGGSNNDYSNEINQIGLKAIRTASYYNEMLRDNEMRRLAEVKDSANVQVMFTILSHVRGYFGDFRNRDGSINLVNDQLFIDSYINFVDTMLNRFGPNGAYFQENPAVPYQPILYWEIWNEPSLHYLLGSDRYPNDLTQVEKADLYARLLIASYNYIRANPEWDDVKIVAMSTAGVHNEIPDFIDSVHAKVQLHGGDPSQCYDILSFHPYTHDCPPDIEDIVVNQETGNINYTYSVINETAKTREVMDKWGNEDKPIWFTEVGWSRFSDDSLPDGRLHPVTERQQAAYVCRLYAITMRLGVEQVHVMFVINGDGSRSGFFDRDHSWYEQAHAAQNFVRLMPKPKIVSAINDGDLGYYAYWINPDAEDPDAEPIVMAWNAEGPKMVNFTVDGNWQYKLVDMFGDSVLINPQKGQIEIPIGPWPVYLVKTNIPNSLQPVILVTPASPVAYNNVILGNHEDITFTVKNIGNVTLTGTVTVNSPFSIVGDAGYSLDADQSKDIIVRFAPLQAGIISDTIIFSGAQKEEITVTGIGIDITSSIYNPELNNELLIYPNPAKSDITVEFPGSETGNISIKIYNIHGRLILFENKKLSNNTIHFNNLNINNGVYGIEIIYKKNTYHSLLLINQ